MEKINWQITPIQWLEKEALKLDNGDIVISSELFEQVKEIEKQHIIKAAAGGYFVGQDNTFSLEPAKEFGHSYFDKCYNN